MRSGDTTRRAALSPFELRYSVLWDQGGRVRFESEGSIWDESTAKVITNHSLRTYDGRVLRVLMPDKHNAVGNPVMSIIREKPSIALSNLWYVPFQLAFCPFDKRLALFSPAQLTVAESRAIVDSHGCAVLEQLSETGDGIVAWADVSRDYVPVRYEMRVRGKALVQINIEYARDQVAGWVPARWKSTGYTDSGDIRSAIWGEAKTYRVNPPLNDADFALRIPTRAWINDGIAHTKYILRDDGTKRMIRPGEFDGTNFYYLVDRDPPSGLNTLRMFGIPVRIVAIGCTVAVILCILAAMYVRGKKRHSGAY